MGNYDSWLEDQAEQFDVMQGLESDEEQEELDEAEDDYYEREGDIRHDEDESR